MPPSGRPPLTQQAFEIDDPFQGLCAQAGIESLADVLGRSECVRDLPRRANLRLRLGDRLVYVKHYKRRRFRPRTPCPEAAGLLWARVHRLPAPAWVFAGYDPARGAVCGTLDLAPARPLDDLLREGRLDGADRRRTRLHLASVVAGLHDHGAHHRDLYLNHVYVDPEREEPVVALIDWDRLGAHRNPFGRWVVKDLAALDASTPATVGRLERAAFLAEYLVFREQPELPDRRLLRRLAARVSRKSRRIRRHVPRTPVGEAARPKEAAS